MTYRSVGVFSNETAGALTIYLEPRCEEIVMSPGHALELLALDDPDVFPFDVHIVKDGIQVYPRYTDCLWLVRFNGQEFNLPPGRTVLTELE